MNEVTSKSSRSVLQQNAPDRMVENDRKTKSKSNDSVVQHSTVDGLNMKRVSLASRRGASHQLIPSKFEDCFEESGKQAKKLLVEYAATQAKTVIAKGREEDGKDAPTEVISALGSEEIIYSAAADCGMFAAVFTAYSHHYNLRSSPDDWWFCVIKRVACAIDRNSKKESVRNMFVEHAEKKTIEVQVDDPGIYASDYRWFFDEITKEIKENVKVPEFVDGMTADFGTTTAVQKIVSQITLMYSVNEYFRFRRLCGCGIPAAEMLGTEEDWMKLTSKLKVLRTLLEPIENDLGLPSEWWDLVQNVFCNLQATYKGEPDEKWWSHIMSYQEEYASGILIITLPNCDTNGTTMNSPRWDCKSVQVSHPCTVAQKCHGNFNLLTAISICSRQFQFAHGSFNFAHDEVTVDFS